MTSPPTQPRIAPVQPPYEPEIESMLAKWMPPASEAEPLALFRTFARHQELAARMRPLGAGILGHGCVQPRDREIVIARTCARSGAEYEWGVHAVAFARPLGLNDEQLRATVEGDAQDPAWSEHDAQLIALADELHDGCAVSDELWAALARRYSDEQLLELLAIAGWYRLISYIINGAQVQAEPWAERFPR